MNGIGYYLGSCSTCARIIGELDLPDEFKLKDIKTDPLTEKELRQMGKMAGSYEALFSRRAMKYREWGLNEKSLSEDDYFDLILKEYTFLKRPVFIVDREIFIGNSKKVVEAARQKLHS